MIQKKPNIIILAGGKSSRMGTDKALLKYKGQTFIQILFYNLKNICSNIIISSNNPKVSIIGTKTISDEIKEIGPMGGIYTCLKNSDSDFNFIVSVDTPFVSSKLLMYIFHKSENFDISVVSFKNKVHPLIGVYHKRILKLLSSEIQAGKYKIMEMIKKTKFQFIEIDGSFEKELLNINKPKDYEILLLKKEYDLK